MKKQWYKCKIYKSKIVINTYVYADADWARRFGKQVKVIKSPPLDWLEREVGRSKDQILLLRNYVTVLDDTIHKQMALEKTG